MDKSTYLRAALAVLHAQTALWALIAIGFLVIILKPPAVLALAWAAAQVAAIYFYWKALRALREARDVEQ